ncbi:oligosaccharyl transferase, archaeosortase A system-associated [Natrarchaeobaculum aegyptiacum]|uniref:dolichyl-phosphooligosaccharide-protein glycotransferase n=1 Tax=Natrarchaeobaculum aegyptiacum TaxID=745377 RepID=A0A2Z2HU87_9EURY|nr:oligosaccharyl transferase, archaeosortase A system-associated [Natrarchaeobaculum aegyptiacum]ARS90811.1 MFS transporter [Natrarchaeobaculum aegyptiacum]
MSTETDHVEERTDLSLLERWDQWYHIPIIGVVMIFMFLTRVQAYDRFAMEDGNPALAAVDSWYHWRAIDWTAENYPRTMPFDIWTGFPDGSYVGQFGTLFDQLIVTAAMIVGLGDPSTETLYTVALLAVPVMAALVAIPVFFAGRRLGGTIGGIVSVVLLALAPGEFLGRSTAGMLQHHVAEVLFMAIAVLAMMVALRVVEQDRPIYELVVDADWNALRRPALYSILAGIALTLYIWVWPPGIALIGIFAIYFTVQLCLDYVRNVSPDHVAFVGAISMGVTAIGTALLIEVPGISTSVTGLSTLQPISAALVAIGCVFMAWFARQWNGIDLERQYYPAAIAGLLVVAFGALAVVLPDLFDTFVGNVQSRMLPIGDQGTAATVAEAQRPPDYIGHVTDQVGTAFFTMLAGLALLVARPFRGRQLRAEHTLVIVWSLIIVSMTATQIRFAYYLVLPVAIVNAVFVAEAIRWLDLDIDYTRSLNSLRQVEGYQVIAVIMVVMLLFAPLLPPIAAATAWDRGAAAQPSGEADTWENSNHWLAENTPEPGNWAGAGYDDEFDYYGTYEYPEDGEYDYPPGSYGVMTWWDYGHLITVQGERIPHSNPFQQNARSSAAYLTSQSEAEAELALDAIAAGISPQDYSPDELETQLEGEDPDAEIRYVMVEDQMVAGSALTPGIRGGKFNAITQWTGPDYQYYTTPEDFSPTEQVERDEIADRFGHLPYDDTIQSQLYFDDAIGSENYRLVHENEREATPFVTYAAIDPETDQLAVTEDGQPLIAVNRMADQWAQMDVAQLQQFGFDVEIIDQRQAPPVKTYERVEGATLTGSVGENVEDPENATVSATVDLETNTDRQFTYVQEGEVNEDGTFELTVAHATNDELGVEDGYTDSAVEALDEYEISVTVPSDDGFDAYLAETEVPERAVVEGETVDVDLEEVDFEDVDPEEEADDEGEDVDLIEGDDLEGESAADGDAPEAEADIGGEEDGADDAADGEE